MKKLFYLAIVLFLCSCSKDDSSEQNSNNNENKQQEKTSIVGVWEYAKYFVSFNDENFCCAYFDNEYIDCGSYTQIDDDITTYNTYYAKQTKYHIHNISNETLKLSIEYTTIHGKDEVKTMTFTKSDKKPAIKDHNLVGKSYSSIAWLGGVNTSIWSFNTYNTGMHSMESGAASEYPLKVYYIFIDNAIFYQTFKYTVQMPTIGGWSPSTVVSKRKISFSSDGSIKSITAE